MHETRLYHEKWRPQFHFTAKQNWLNDPNGLVYYAGEYHLFFQYNPMGREWGNMHWGHAVSSDLVHWEELPVAIGPDEHGAVFSGSALVDWENRTGFEQGENKTLLAYYTGAGKQMVQCLAYSSDRGRTWHKYAGNPVVPNIGPEDRDPKVIFHAKSQRWIMVLYVQEQGINGIWFFTSEDLLHWSYQSRVEGFYECPDLFELPVEGNPTESRWILLAADGQYRIGQFDGITFLPEAEKLTGDYGGNFYASQSYSDIPEEDGRRIQIGWMRGGEYPEMPFNQQMTVPCTLSLRATSDGLRVCKLPVQELWALRGAAQEWMNVTIRPEENLLPEIAGELLDIEACFTVGEATAFGIRLRGAEIQYNAVEERLTVLGRSAPLKPEEGQISLRILLDRTSVEVYANGGVAAFSSCFLAGQEGIELFAEGGDIVLSSLKIYLLRTIWQA